jgi:hypothetical protein
MTNATQPKPIPSPAQLVFGKPRNPELPQAFWFRAEDRLGAMEAAQPSRVQRITPFWLFQFAR